MANRMTCQTGKFQGITASTSPNGSGDTKADAPGGGLDALRKDVYNTHGRKARMRAV
jgi:hypothetical protein